jgi:hypothetical protein
MNDRRKPTDQHARRVQLGQRLDQGSHGRR